MKQIGVRVGESMVLFRNANEKLESGSSKCYNAKEKCITVLHDRLQKYESVIKEVADTGLIDGHTDQCNYAVLGGTGDCTCGFDRFRKVSYLRPVSYDVDVDAGDSNE